LLKWSASHIAPNLFSVWKTPLSPSNIRPNFPRRSRFPCNIAPQLAEPHNPSFPPPACSTPIFPPGDDSVSYSPLRKQGSFLSEWSYSSKPPPFAVTCFSCIRESYSCAGFLLGLLLCGRLAFFFGLDATIFLPFKVVAIYPLVVSYIIPPRSFIHQPSFHFC